ncbi:hypothetical protein ACNQ1M_00465 [Mycoplasma sp. VS424B]
MLAVKGTKTKGVDAKCIKTLNWIFIILSYIKLEIKKLAQG